MRGIAVPGDYPNLVQLAQEATGATPIATTATPAAAASNGAPAPVSVPARADTTWPLWLLPLTGIVGLAAGLFIARVIPRRASSRDTRDHRTAPG